MSYSSNNSSVLICNEELQVKVAKPHHKRNKILVISGPTGVGKTLLSILLAERLNGEIVSADSVQIYRGLDIGTAKATLEQRQRVVHHMIDICDVVDTYNVVDFFYMAKSVCDSIIDNNKVPIITGGSGFYIRALLYGPPSGPPEIKDIRTAVENEMKEVGVQVMYDRLLLQDPEYAKTITRGDKHKIARAFEIMAITGDTVSKQVRCTGAYDPSNFICWFIHSSRETMRSRIDQRCDEMIAAGLLEEVEGLMSKGLQENPITSKAIGYRQGIEFLNSNKTAKDYSAFIESFKTASKRYAKKQVTWFKKEEQFVWLDVDKANLEQVADQIARDYLNS